MKQNYHIEDYRFTACCVFYQGEYVSTYQLIKHLNHWWPGVDWKKMAKKLHYNELKFCLKTKVYKK